MKRIKFSPKIYGQLVLYRKNFTCFQLSDSTTPHYPQTNPMNSLKISSITLSLLIMTATLQDVRGQWLPGELVTAGGKTLNGNVNYGNWRKNPKIIEFQEGGGLAKEYSASEASQVTIHLGNGEKEIYAGHEVAIDFSSLDLKKLDSKAEPDRIVQTVFLRTLVIGKVNLFGLTDANGKNHYFASKGPATPQELTYRKYYINKEVADGSTKDMRTSTGVADVMVSSRYKNELYNMMTDSPTLKKEDFESLEYKEESMINLVSRYNGQSNYVWTPEKIGFSLDVLASVAFINQRDDIFNVPIPARTSMGPGLGLNLDFPRSRFSIQNNLRYTMFRYSKKTESGTDNYEIVNFTFNYVKLQNLFRYDLPISSNMSMYFEGGLLSGILFKEEVLTQRHFYGSDSEVMRDSFGKKGERGLVFGTGVRVNKFYLGADYEMSSGYRFSFLQPTFKTLYFTLAYRL